MSSKARLPNPEIQDRAARAAELAVELADLLEDLEEDETWDIWNLGGAAFGQHELRARGPGVFTARQLTDYADKLARSLERISDSFLYRSQVEAIKFDRYRETGRWGKTTAAS